MDRRLVAAVKALSAQQDGVVLLPQLIKLGGSAQMARSLVEGGHMRSGGRAILLDPGHPMDGWMALRIAFGRAGPLGVASHRSAAWLHGLVDDPPPVPTISVPRSVSARTETVIPVRVVHTQIPLEPVRERGFPVTNASRAIADVAAIAKPSTLDRMVDRAFERGKASVTSLQRELARQSSRPGVRALAEQLGRRSSLDLPGQSVLESAANKLLIDMCDRHGLPLPEREQRVFRGRYRLDYAWPAILLAVEVDGYRWHGSKAQRDHDYDRRSEITAHQWVTMPFSWEQVVDRPDVVADRIAATYRWLSELRQVTR